MGDITDRRPQRSAAVRTCFVPGMHNSFGERSFSAAVPVATFVEQLATAPTRHELRTFPA